MMARLYAATKSETQLPYRKCSCIRTHVAQGDYASVLVRLKPVNGIPGSQCEQDILSMKRTLALHIHI